MNMLNRSTKQLKNTYTQKKQKKKKKHPKKTPNPQNPTNQLKQNKKSHKAWYEWPGKNSLQVGCLTKSSPQQRLHSGFNPVQMFHTQVTGPSITPLKWCFTDRECTTKGSFIAKQQGHSAAREPPLLGLWLWIDPSWSRWELPRHS